MDLPEGHLFQERLVCLARPKTNKTEQTTRFSSTKTDECTVVKNRIIIKIHKIQPNCGMFALIFWGAEASPIAKRNERLFSKNKHVNIKIRQ